MRAVTIRAFGVTMYGNNDKMEKRHDKKKPYRYRKDRFVFLYFTVFVVKNFEFRSM